jgi:tetratricopeptide (TPR) repeat protein
MPALHWLLHLSAFLAALCLQTRMCDEQLGQYDKAIVDYTRALEVDPANGFAYYNRGITKDRMGDFKGAVADFSSAIALDPKNADFYHNRGFSLRKQVGTCRGAQQLWQVFLK